MRPVVALGARRISHLVRHPRHVAIYLGASYSALGHFAPNSQIDGCCSVPIRWIEVASTEPAQEQNSAPDNCLTLGFEPLPRNPSPVPLRLAKTPAAGHPLPKGEGGFHNFNAHQKRQPSPRGEGARRRRAGEGFFPSRKPGTSSNLRFRVCPVFNSLDDSQCGE